jgi:hypothetical protein
LEMIGAELSKEWREVDKEQLYEAGWRKGVMTIFLLGVGEAKFQCYLLGSVAFVWIWIVFSWGQKSLWIFLSLNLAVDLLLCQKHQEKTRRSSVCILGTRAREMMNESKI